MPDFRKRFKRASKRYGWGVGVVATLGGMIGYVTCGCSPVNDLRNAVMLAT
jgi:hypothetical protein